ncbi:MAG: hypothetical protein ACKPKO_01040, partial [Candidatus Fonsibacter sp.]
DHSGGIIQTLESVLGKAVADSEEPKDVLAELEGTAILRNVDAMSMGHLAKFKEKIEREQQVRLDLDARFASIWSNVGDRQKALDAKEAIEEELVDITQVDTLTVQV